MMKIPKKVQDRVVDSLKIFVPVISDAIARDVSEADTVTVVKDVLSEVFGYNKYLDLTSEQQIRGTYCDLAVKMDGKVRFLIEVKAAGSDLNENHLRQAINYGVHEGIEWIVLTNASIWKLYRLSFGQPVSYDEVSYFNLMTTNPKAEDDIQRLFLLCREALVLNAMDTFHQNSMLLNKYTVGHLILSEPILSALRREMRRLFPDLKVDPVQLGSMLSADIIKRDVLDGDKAKECQARVRKAQQKLARKAAKKDRSLSEDVADSGVNPAADEPLEQSVELSKEQPEEILGSEQDPTTAA